MTHCLCALSLWPDFITDKLIIRRRWWPKKFRATPDWISQQSHLHLTINSPSLCSLSVLICIYVALAIVWKLWAWQHKIHHGSSDAHHEANRFLVSVSFLRFRETSTQKHMKHRSQWACGRAKSQNEVLPWFH